MKRNISTRICAILLIVSMLIPMLPVDAFAADTESTQAQAVETITIVAGTDFQGRETETESWDSDNAVNKRLASITKIMDQIVAAKGDTIDNFFFLGDYASETDTVQSADQNPYWKSRLGLVKLRAHMTQYVSTKDEASYNDMFFVEGNHEYGMGVEHGLTGSGPHDRDAFGTFIIDAEDLENWNDNGTSEDEVNAVVASMKAYFDEKIAEDYKKPIFILAHYPLHYSLQSYWGGAYPYASYLVDVMNDAGAAGLNIIYMFGHQHSSYYTDYLGGEAVYLKRNDTLLVPNPATVGMENGSYMNKGLPLASTLQFTYMNAGYVGYYGAYNDTDTSDLSMTVFQITGNEVTIERYNENGRVDLKNKGEWRTHDPNFPETAAYYGVTDAYLNTAYTTDILTPTTGNEWVPVYTYAWEQADAFYNGNQYLILTGNTGGTTAQAVGFGNKASYAQDPDGNWYQYVTVLKDIAVNAPSGGITRPYVETHDTDLMFRFEQNPDFTTGMGAPTGKLYVCDNSQFPFEERGLYGLFAEYADAAWNWAVETPDTGAKSWSNALILKTTDWSEADMLYNGDVNGRYTFWSYNPSYGVMTAYAGGHGNYGATFAENWRLYLRHRDGKLFTRWGSGIASSSTGATYIYGRTNKISSTEYVQLANNEFTILAGEYGSYFQLESMIKSNLVLNVSSSADGSDAVVQDGGYTLSGTASVDQAGIYRLVVNYKGAEVGSVKINVIDRASLESATVSTIGQVYINAPSSADTGAELTLTAGNESTVNVPVTLDMLKAANQQAVDTSRETTYTKLKVYISYYDSEGVKQEKLVYSDFTLHVVDADYPQYPNPGSVKVDKNGSGIDFQNTGVAQVELSATGIPYQSGVDVILMLDTSGSMRDWVDTTVTQDEAVQRIEALRQSVNNLIDQLKESVETGKAKDIKIAIADFNDYTVDDAYSYNWDNTDYLAYEESYNLTDLGQTAGTTQGVRTGDIDDFSAAAFVDVTTLNNNGFEFATRENIYDQAGTNYDSAFDMIYKLGSAIREENAQNGQEGRELIVIFMTDGGPVQFNFFRGVSGVDLGEYDLWASWYTGSADDLFSTGTAGYLNASAAAHMHYYHTEGKHWTAEAIKGSQDATYPIISKVAEPAEGWYNGLENMISVKGLDATMYTIGFGIQYMEDYTDEATTLLQTIASTDSNGDPLLQLVETEDELYNSFTNIGNAIIQAATGAYMLDTMGEDYDLLMKNYIQKSDGTTHGTIPTIQVIETTKSRAVSTVLEEVTFNAEGTAAYSNLIGDTTNILTDGVICAKYFWYNANSTAVMIDADGDGTAEFELPAETFYWKLGIISETKLTLKYYVYLTDALDDNKDNVGVPAGTYPTNESATLYYTNYLGHQCELDTISPELPWKTAQVSYGYYLVNEKGEILSDPAAGTTTTDFADRIELVPSTIFAQLDLNTGSDLSSIINSIGKLPQGYELYVTNGVDYTIQVNSGDGKGSWTISDTTGTTYVTGYYGSSYTTLDSQEFSAEESDSFDYSNTTVWFAVVYKAKTVEDIVVIDFGIPVDVSVLGNDIFGGHAHLDGIGPLSAMPEAGFSETLSSEFTSHWNGAYGTAQMNGEKIRYTLSKANGMQMESVESFVYAVHYTGTDGAGIYYGIVTVTPAANIYYEDTFLTYTDAANAYVTSNGERIETGDLTENVIVDLTKEEESAETIEDYYLFGFINGANYACEEDGANLGTYKFVNGKLTMIFAQDSYVGVKSADNATWYMTNGWLGTDVTSATLYDTNWGIEANKLYVPAGKEIEFTLTENSDGTLTLSYVINEDLTDYYLFGYINGANYACEGDYSHMGQYKFVNGKLTATFAENSYVAVKKSGNTAWYMTQGWQGEVSSATLYDTSAGFANADKLYIPGGIEIEFTLTENADGTLTLSYAPVKGETDYYLFGFINGADYACEDDASNMGVYQFTDGKLITRFDTDSYVAVKTGGNTAWFMTNGWLGFDATSAALYNTTTLGSNANKLFVPAGKVVEFTLGQDADGNLTLSYSYLATMGVWEVVSDVDDTNSVITQEEDRPGADLNNALGSLDADNVYGYDAAYDSCKEFSLGKTYKVTVNAETGTIVTGPKASFTFSGTGFDVVSLTNNQSGVITVSVYAVNTDGTVAEEKTRSLIVSNYYGYTYEDGEWVVTPDAGANGLYQVPVMKVEGLAYGKYYVEIQVVYMSSLDKTPEEGYSFWMDAIRIYDPAKTAADTEGNIIEDVYEADKEANPDLTTVKKLLLDADTILNADATSSHVGAMFIDGKNAISSGSSNMSDLIADYANQGPNNEAYLQAGQAIAFRLISNADPSQYDYQIHLGAKLAQGSGAVMNVSGITGNKTITTATNMFYPLALTWTQDETNNMWYADVVIVNVSDAADPAILSITDLKVTSTNGAVFGTTLNAANEAAAVANRMAAANEVEPVLTAVVNHEIITYAVSRLEELDIIENGSSEEDAPKASLSLYSISLTGNIAINYYVSLDESLLEDANAYMVFTMADGSVIRVPVSNGVPKVVSGKTYYVFTCEVAAKEMTDEVKSQFVYTGGSSKEYTRTVKGYAEYLLANSGNANLKTLITAMLNYGAAAQVHFGYNTDRLANEGIDGAVSDYDVALSNYTSVSGQGTDNVKFCSASLILKSETTLRMYFTAQSSDFTVSYQGEDLAVMQKGNYYYVDITGISARNLDEAVTVTINDGTAFADVTYNPMAYCQTVLSDTTGVYAADMKNVVAALYLYNQAANTYFGEK
ncbi:MAG: VWA domain-containing protein [Oscillospiraceae bacterium]|nr:VWA domain-containing protein [Oscillospiraceae bacterium]